nr:hypothetical protein [Limobrevibacterium gyesilva]
MASVAGCGPDYSPNTYSGAAVQQANKVDRGVVVGVRTVDVSAAGAVGAVTGGAAGGIVGSQTPGGGVASAFGALGGTVLGGLVGTTVEHTVADTKAFEYVVRKPNGDLLSVTQKDATPLSLGQKVLVIAGAQARIVPDYTVTVEPEAPAASASDKAETKDVPAPVTAAPLEAPAPAATLPAALPSLVPHMSLLDAVPGAKPAAAAP